MSPKKSESLHIVTPLLESKELSRLAGRRVWLKMENMQPGGSFKIRGIGHTMQEAVSKLGVTRFIGSSGGNAGMAMAVAAQKMNVPLTIYIPTSTKPFMIDNLKNYCADVVVTGENWNQANEAAKEALKQEGTFLVHPYDQPDTWEGHSTLVQELQNQLPQAPGCIVSCVGGGGLVLGLLQGLEKAGWSSTPVLAMETEGAHCFAAARQAGQVVQLAGITSVATSLGALSVSETLFNLSVEKGVG
ncbi:serine dehydratase-like isoform X2 [Eurytemora carolleeae]|uniref:serine dehydratase-like isoform X2 n=1 Tax=Eurytemora carolleeae TaxID=1294199 RepID=UPI000C75AD53|nr:serine dehydratase-like isoform X2 [Eurytemora carolleeae]|eukprot:XP_023321257.1 serine dehydratase-like isoform X2 [Eurytemora affinis]